PLALGRDPGIVDEGMKRPAIETAADLLHPAGAVRRIAEIDLDVILGPGFPRAAFGKAMARAGDDPPSRAREALDGRVSDPPARTGEHQRLAFVLHGRNPPKRSWPEGSARPAYPDPITPARQGPPDPCHRSRPCGCRRDRRAAA